jgi:uncharacterized membrane protein
MYKDLIYSRLNQFWYLPFAIMNQKEKRNLILIILLVVLIVCLYIATIGKVDLSSNEGDADSNRMDADEKLKESEAMHERLEEALHDKKRLKRRLDHSVNIGYFFVRLLCVFVFAVYNYLLYQILGLRDFSQFVSYNNGALIILAVLLFLFFQRPKNLLSTIRSLHTRIENLVYRKYGELDGEIAVIEQEISTLRNYSTDRISISPTEDILETKGANLSQIQS